MSLRFALPDVTGHRRFVTAVAVDALGSGVFMPVSILYFLNTTPLSLPEVGLAMSISGALAVPLILVIGSLVDRVGAKRILLAANALQALALASYLFATQLPTVIAATSLAALGQVAFWASYSPMVAAISRPGEREMWVGFLGALRNLGFAVGGLASGIAVSIGTPAAYHAVVLVNAASYLLALLLLLGVPGPPPSPHPQDRSGWGLVLRDRPYHALVATNVAYALCALALNVAMPVYAVETLGLPGWVGGAVFVVNTVLIAGGQGLAVGAMTGHRRHRVAQLGFVVYAAGFLVLAGAGLLPAAAAVVLVLLGVVVYSIGELLGGPVLNAAALESAPEHLRGRYFSLYQLSWNAATIIAPAAYTALLAAARPAVWAALIGIAGAGVLLTALAARLLPAAHAVVTNLAEPEDRSVDGPARERDADLAAEPS